ncbi:MAG: BlaI/MecI/CopY family transcriptional regulator [Solirubrobacterales bacterium]
MTAKRRPSGALESEVLATLWAADGPLTPAVVQRELGGELAYTTVLTALVRLYDKGVISRERAGRGFAYRPVLDRPGIAAAEMRRLLDSGDDREAVLASFVGSLSDDEERALLELLERQASEDGTAG